MERLEKRHLSCHLLLFCRNLQESNQNLAIGYDCWTDLASQLVHAPEQACALNWELLGSGKGQFFIFAQLHPMY